MNILTEKAYSVKIYLAGDYADAVRACRKYVMCGLCVTVERADYVYTGGMESGVIVGLVNYPRFPSDPLSIMEKAESLAVYLMSELSQTSVMVCDGIDTKWITTRDV